MKRILVIPHVAPNANLRIRSVEIARHLASSADNRVYLLDWSPPKTAPKGFFYKIYQRFADSCGRIRLRPRIQLVEGIWWTTLPLLLFPRPLDGIYNEYQLLAFIRRERIDCVINANSFHFPIRQLRAPSFLYVYDLVDDHLSPEPHRAWKRTRAFSLRELRKADFIVTISNSLRDLVREETGMSSLVVPNGVDLATCRYADSQAVAAIRRKYELENTLAIIYIGNHGGWFSNIPFLAGAVARLNSGPCRARLVVVGPVDPEEQKRAMQLCPSAVFTGPVPAKDVASYFHAADIGVLPFVESPFTHNALPLKVLEYGAARKRVIATPLRELEILQFPHVELVPLDEERWSRALETSALTKWCPEWDHTIDLYDWQTVLDPLTGLIAGPEKL